MKRLLLHSFILLKNRGRRVLEVFENLLKIARVSVNYFLVSRNETGHLVDYLLLLFNVSFIFVAHFRYLIVDNFRMCVERCGMLLHDVVHFL